MELLASLWDLAVHLDVHLAAFVQERGVWVYVLLFLIIFCETGLVVTPILPGDSMLFAFGALAANPSADINVHFSAFVFISAAFLGNLSNYSIGRYIGPKVYE